MTAITYTARRSLVEGHTAGDEYSLDVRMSAIDPAHRVEREEHTAQDGTSEVVWNRIEETWRFTTATLSEAAMRQLLEFLNSHVSGEPFTVDPYGTVDAPDAPFSAKLVSTNHAPARVSSQRRYRLSFEVRKQ